MKKLLATVFLCGAASSHAMTGNDLMKFMSMGADGDIVLQAYVRGVGDASYLTIGAFVVKDGRRVPIQPFCMPQGASYEQAKDIVRAFINNNAPVRHYPAVILVHDALGAAWPCPSR